MQASVSGCHFFFLLFFGLIPRTTPSAKIDKVPPPSPEAFLKTSSSTSRERQSLFSRAARAEETPPARPGRVAGSGRAEGTGGCLDVKQLWRSTVDSATSYFAPPSSRSNHRERTGPAPSTPPLVVTPSCECIRAFPARGARATPPWDANLTSFFFFFVLVVFGHF